MNQPTNQIRRRRRGPGGNVLEMYREGQLFVSMKRQMQDHPQGYYEWLNRYFINRGIDTKTYVRRSMSLVRLIDSHFGGDPRAVMHIPLSALHILSQDDVLSDSACHSLITGVHKGEIESKPDVLRSLRDTIKQGKALPLSFPIVTQQPLVEVEEEEKASSPDLATILRTVGETLLQAVTEIERLSLVS